MKNNVKVSAFAGTILFVLAALFSISLLLVLFDFGGSNFIYDTFFYKLGKMFVDVYGYDYSEQYPSLSELDMVGYFLESYEV